MKEALEGSESRRGGSFRETRLKDLGELEAALENKDTKKMNELILAFKERSTNRSSRAKGKGSATGKGSAKGKGSTKGKEATKGKGDAKTK